MPKPRGATLCGAFVFVLPLAAAAAEIGLTVERATVAEGTRMGLTGLHYRADVAPDLSLGASVFGAVSGDRGGFFGWGLTSAYRRQFGAWSAEGGLFVGGGGGSPSWVGGGLMLRPHLGFAYDWGPLRAGLGVSQLWFPNGSVRSNQPYASLSWSGGSLYSPGSGGAASVTADRAVAALPTETGLTLSHYEMRRDSVRRDGGGDAPPLRAAGVSWRRAMAGHTGALQPYWLLSTAGSLTAEYAGYAELYGGAGVRHALPFYTPLSLRVEAAVGAAGAGAALDTGGGLVGRIGAGLSWQLSRNIGVSVLVGRAASRGPFIADEARIELAYLGWDGVVAKPQAALPGAPELGWAPWAAMAGLTYLPSSRRDDGSEPGLTTAALKLEREVGAHWRLVGQAGIATNGDAGGYATGQLGVGWLSGSRADAGWRFGAEATLGAAGGGGVAVGEGLVGQFQLQARRALSPSWALQAEAGWLRSRGGDLSSPTLGVGLVYSFSRLQAL